MTDRRSSRVRLIWFVGSMAVALALVACNAPSATSPSGAATTGIGGSAIAGPVCPVERNPPDPSCAPRPVAGATIVIRDSSGAQVGAAVSGLDGAFFVSLPPGTYVVEPRPVEGLPGTAPPQPALVADGTVTVVKVEFDTGIR